MKEHFFISDLHLGDPRILLREPELRKGSDLQEHENWLIQQWNSVVPSQNSKVWVLGDLAYSEKDLKCLPLFNGEKNLVLGNNDKLPVKLYSQYFSKVFGLKKYKKNFWLSHIPVHSDHLEQRLNVHGHLHSDVVVDDLGRPDPRYFNVSVELNEGKPFHLDEICDRATRIGINAHAEIMSLREHLLL